MRGINKVLLFGYLGHDPQSEATRTGRSVTRLSLATHYPVRKEDGGWEDRTSWHKVNVWGKQGERCASFLKKGAAVMIEGYLAPYSKETEEGSKLRFVSVTAQRVEAVQPGKRTPWIKEDPEGAFGVTEAEAPFSADPEGFEFDNIGETSDATLSTN